mmetsp:Transcript_57561/g.105893  ORF Transcript_57561/g.105893 Transcript_57561/m.105893 type:complete len:427 (+) Transcript_57561:24-1304(+)
MSRFIKSNAEKSAVRCGAPGGDLRAPRSTGFTDAELAAAEWSWNLVETRTNISRVTNEDIRMSSRRASSAASSLRAPTREGFDQKRLKENVLRRPGDGDGLAAFGTRVSHDDEQAIDALIVGARVAAASLTDDMAGQAFVPEKREKPKKKEKTEKKKEKKGVKEKKALKEEFIRDSSRERRKLKKGANKLAKRLRREEQQLDEAATAINVASKLHIAADMAQTTTTTTPLDVTDTREPDGVAEATNAPRDPRNPLDKAYDVRAYQVLSQDGRLDLRHPINEPTWNHLGYLRRSPSPCRLRTRGPMFPTRRGAWKSRAGGVYLPPTDDNPAYIANRRSPSQSLSPARWAFPEEFEERGRVMTRRSPSYGPERRKRSSSNSSREAAPFICSKKRGRSKSLSNQRKRRKERKRSSSKSSSLRRESPVYE